MRIYVDVIFLINFVMNSIILLLTAWTAGISYKWGRLLFAAAAGSFYMIGEMVADLSGPLTTLLRCVISVLLLLLAFGKKRVSSFLFLIGILYIVSFTLGGAVVGWSYFGQTRDSTLLWRQLSLTDLAGGCTIGLLAVTILTKRISAKLFRRSTLYPITLSYGGRAADMSAMLDTGNALSSIISCKPVVIVNYERVKQILSQDALRYLDSTQFDLWLVNLCECQDADWLERVEVIPYHSVGRRSTLLGFRPDLLTVTTSQGVISTTDIVIGIYHSRLCENKTYEALLNPSVLHNITIKQEAKACVSLGQS